MLELNRVHHGDNLALLRQMPDNCIDAVVTDPPYGLSFMGKQWDYDVPSVEQWAEVLRVLKPGGHLLSFAGTRTQHRMAVNIEDAGFEIRDLVMWVYASGFPKSLDVSKAIDKAAGAERNKIRTPMGQTGNKFAKGLGDTRPWMEKAAELGYHEHPSDEPATDAARNWQGWGTALKPALEPITLARKPLVGTVAANVLEHGTGAINVDECRVEHSGEALRGGGCTKGKSSKTQHVGWARPWMDDEIAREESRRRSEASQQHAEKFGRWPANLIHDGSDEVVGLFPANGDKSAARFFYVAKPTRKERDEGCESLEARDKYGPAGQWGSHDCFSGKSGDEAWQAKNPNKPKANHHPTVKPVELMEYLVRLVSREGQIVLDPWGGSGTTGVACKALGRQFILMEQAAEYVQIAEARIGAKQQRKLL